jgi:hypothetical protein
LKRKVMFVVPKSLISRLLTAHVESLIILMT